MPRYRCQSSLRNRRGFTLLELLVVGMLGVLALTIIANAWRWYSRSLADAEVSAMLTRELKLATDSIAQFADSDGGPQNCKRFPPPRHFG